MLVAVLSHCACDQHHISVHAHAGHVLVAPRRMEARFKGLCSEEAGDLWQLAQTVARMIEAHHSADSLSLVIQA